jgi:hypothetical protein
VEAAGVVLKFWGQLEAIWPFSAQTVQLPSAMQRSFCMCKTFSTCGGRWGFMAVRICAVQWRTEDII